MNRTRELLVRWWPWFLLLLAVCPAIWHVRTFETDIDPEYPLVERQTYSAYPPFAYRLAEPGDTIDRVSLSAASAAVVLSLWGWLRSKRARPGPSLWPIALGLALIAWWDTATPGPCPDGWHGLGWRVLINSKAPAISRLFVAGLALVLGVGLAIALLRAWPRRREWLDHARQDRWFGLLIASAVLVALRQVDPPGLGPSGYGPRWCLAWGIIAFDLALCRALLAQRSLRVEDPHPALSRGERETDDDPLPSGEGGRRPGEGDLADDRPKGVAGSSEDRIAEASVVRGRWFRLTPIALGVTFVLAWLGLTHAGIALVKYHRPIERLKEVVPGKIFICAMPTYRGLELAQRRHSFRTIINLFPEDTPQRSPLWPQELCFVAEHPEIRYLRSSADPDQGDAFLDETLRIAQDPKAWPILIHCHACMDRTPAWLGIYRFVVEGRPLIDVLREIEQHRGTWPHATVTLLFNHALPRLAPERAASDPTAQLLKRNAARSPNPYNDPRAGLAHLADDTAGRKPVPPR